MNRFSLKSRQPGDYARLARRALDSLLPVALVLLAAWLLWPAFGAMAFWSAIAAGALTACVAALLSDRSSATNGADCAQPVAGFERTHTAAELSAARSAGRDSLTGLPDAFALLDFGAPRLVREQPRLLAVIELSWLGEFNLRFGRDHGDQVLLTVAGMLEDSLRDEEIAARCRGGQFALLLESASVGDSFRRLSEVQAAIGSRIKQSFGIETNTHTGLAWYPRHGLNMSTLLHRARIALNAAESSDQPCVIYSPAADTSLELERDLTQDLARAIENDSITLNFQPVVPLHENGNLALEVLSRWEHPEWGMISPETFVALAEHGGFINRLTRMVVRRAVAQLRLWQSEGIETDLAINLSANDLFDDTFPAFLSRTCEAAGVSAHKLILEVTETTMISDVARARLTLRRLRAIGVRVVIDDFGTGYSSLAHLRQLPVDGIKIDKSFVTTMRRGSNDSTIVRVSIELAHSLGLRVTAEGVESEYIEDRLLEFQCDALQGFHICPPICAEAVSGWLLSNDHGGLSSRLRQQHLPFREAGALPAT